MSQVFKPKEYFRPSTIEETIELLSRHGERAKIVGGGTGIYEVAHRGLLSDVECLVDIELLQLDRISVECSLARIGAATTMAKMMDSSELSQLGELSVLHEALRAIQPLQVKNVATIGGAICTALPFFDLPVALIALDASVKIAPKIREVKVLDFIRGYFSIDLQSGELVTEIILPLKAQKEVAGSAFEKFALTGDDWALINCGAHVSLDGNTISKARLCFGGGIGEKPKRVREVEKSLEGVRVIDEDGVKNILDQKLFSDLETISDIRASSEYRAHLAKVLGKRSLMRAGRRALELAGEKK
jgi:CO/xanthine dehydrogenase FAD-binding subunit